MLLNSLSSFLDRYFWYFLVIASTVLLVFRANGRKKYNTKINSTEHDYNSGIAIILDQNSEKNGQSAPELIMHFLFCKLKELAIPPAWNKLTSNDREILKNINATRFMNEPQIAKIMRKGNDIQKAIITNVKEFDASYFTRYLIGIREKQFETELKKYREIATSKPLATLKKGLFDFLVQKGDSDLWHYAVQNLNYDYEETLQIVLWIVQNPLCDRATAVVVLDLMQSDYYLDFDPKNISQPEYDLLSFRIVETICDRSETETFTAHEFLKPYELDSLLKELRKEAAALKSKNKEISILLPEKLLLGEFGTRQAKENYFINDDTIYGIVSGNNAPLLPWLLKAENQTSA